MPTLRAAPLPGRIVFAAALLGFGLQFLIFAWWGKVPPGPPWPRPAGTTLAVSLGLLFLVFSVGCLVKTFARATALLGGLLLAVYAVAMYLPALRLNDHTPTTWTSCFEVLAFAGAALSMGASGGLGRAGRLIFAIALAVFGVQHFVYAGYVANLIPAALPARGFLAVVTGAAFLATGVAIVLKVKSQLATAIIGGMMLLFLLVVHVPDVLAAPRDGGEWTSALVALAMAGAAFIVAGTGVPVGKEAEGKA